nr:aflatoxin B1 aldehyde reductase member 4-like [Pongo pygmaeus]
MLKNHHFKAIALVEQDLQTVYSTSAPGMGSAALRWTTRKLQLSPLQDMHGDMVILDGATGEIGSSRGRAPGVGCHRGR